MEQKIIKMPFDIELAKKITEKSVKGRIVTRDGRNARIACWNYKSLSGEYPLLVLIENGIFEAQELYTLNGKEKSFIKEACDSDLVLEVPEHLESACDNSPILSNSPKIGKKEEKLREAVHEHYQCNGKYPCSERAYCRFCEGENIAHDCDEDCCADEFSEGFLSGWDACMKNLAELPWDEAINEIVNNCKEKKY